VLLIGLFGLAGCSESNSNGDQDGDDDADALSNSDSPADGPADQPADENLDDGEPCVTIDDCATGAVCCKGFCSNLAYDPLNCGKCGFVCQSDTPFCSGSKCLEKPCQTVCIDESMCCDTDCCLEGQICCAVQRGGPMSKPQCYYQHCPAGCPTCD
jgi:hypothetical protein